MESRRRIRGDELAHEEGVVLRRGGVNGRPGMVHPLAHVLKMDIWQMAAGASESASNSYVPQTRDCGLVGVSDFRCLTFVRSLFDIELGFRYSFIKWIGVSTYVAKIMT